MYEKVLVPLALNHGISAATLEVARALCAPGGEIVALHVFEVPQGSVRAYMGDATIQQGFEHASEVLKEKIAGLDGVKAEITRGHASRAIIEYAVGHGVDCIVIGSHKPDMTDFFLGSTAARVVRHAPCAVHVHRDT